jgi:hypothetical protein
MSAPPNVEPLYAAIVRLQMENALLKKRSPDEYGPETLAGAGYRPTRRLSSWPLPSLGVSTQQLFASGC